VGSVGTVAAAVDVVPPDCGVVADAPLAVVDVTAAVEAASVDASLHDFLKLILTKLCIREMKKVGRPYTG
jgi:hypothetical protein